MAEFGMPEYKVAVEQLKPGVFIRLERRNWFSHPFLFNSFLIKDEGQIQVLRELGIREVTCVPEKCNCLPCRCGKNRTRTATVCVAGPDHGPQAPSAGAGSHELSPELERLWRIKRERAERLRQKREAIARCEERYVDAVRTAEELRRGVLAGDNARSLEALEFVRGLVSTFLGDAESTLHLMNVLKPEEHIYSHELNVTILSLLLGRENGLDQENLVLLGLAALLHDVGKERIDRKLLKKRGPLTRPEVQLLQRHVDIGRDLLMRLPSMPLRVVDAVYQHHEMLDGSGYPLGLTGEAVGLAARIVAVTNVYDNLCNHADPERSLTPYLSLSYMFTQRRDQLDPDLLSQFIRCMGVYPPGTVVQLSNGAIGMVMAVNPENQLCPSLVMYDPEIPRKEALIVDLAEDPELKVEKSIRLAHLPDEILTYLSPRTRISYYLE
ncbi:MAG: HD-GYP domain-containing protein [Desulfovibrio sp.]|jgi:putative nucleotidyltransferase with HDIG domain